VAKPSVLKGGQLVLDAQMHNMGLILNSGIKGSLKMLNSPGIIGNGNNIKAYLKV
jgi:hypothetical protein